MIVTTVKTIKVFPCLVVSSDCLICCFVFSAVASANSRAEIASEKLACFCFKSMRCLSCKRCQYRGLQVIKRHTCMSAQC